MNFNWNLISKYRQELFGICIIGVLAGHVIELAEVKQPTLQIILKTTNIIGVRGFIFLSGIGLYYSWKNKSINHYLKSFYIGRIIRVYLPYLFITLPYWIWSFGIQNRNIFKLITSIIPISFWIYGNEKGMWYIDFILICYLIFPFINLCFTNSNKKILLLFALITMILIINFILFKYSNSYYRLIEIGMIKIPLFILGNYCGNFVYNNKNIRTLKIIIFTIIWFLLYIFIDKSNMFYDYLCSIRSILGCLYLSKLLDVIRFLNLNKLLKYIGAMSLELYLIHLCLGDVLSEIIQYLSSIGFILLRKIYENGTYYWIVILLTFIIGINYRRLNQLIGNKLKALLLRRL